MSGLDLRIIAREIAFQLRQHFPEDQEWNRQVFALAEETGEFVGAYRRWAGMARRTGSWDDVEAELADVVITAYVTAHCLEIDIDQACERKLRTVFGRGWRDATTPTKPDPEGRS
jgi:NTP pyrophosphatase (non-canonical NTP hydrolase)